MATPSLAAAPPAGTIIGNQATATFQSGGQIFTVTSNLVQTTVNKVAAVDVETAQTKTGVAGGIVYFPHTVTNNGNAADNFALTTSAVDPNLTVTGIYADANCDGVPDNTTAITQTGALNPGDSACVVVQVNVGAGAATGTAPYTLTAATTMTDAANYVAGSPATPSRSNTDNVTITAGASLEFTKSMTLLTDLDGSGTPTPGDTVQVKLAYANNGGADATNVIIDDVLPGGLTYAAATGAWSDAAGTLDDAVPGVDATSAGGATITYSATGTEAGATISTVPVGKSGYLTFNVTIADNASGTIVNTATLDTDQTALQHSNAAQIVVPAAIAVTLADAAVTNKTMAGAPSGETDGAYSSDVSTTDQDTSKNDVVSYTSTDFATGSSVPFDVVLTNHSSIAQGFNLTAALGNFPVGTTFTFLSNGAPMLDSNGDGIPDLQVASQTAVHLTVVANLPAGTTRASGDPAWQATATATSVVDSSISNHTTLSMADDVTVGDVDIQNADGKSTGHVLTDPENANAPWTTDIVDAGQPAKFTLVVVNNGTTSDTFNLAYSSTNFAAGTMPAGWQVVFHDADDNVVTSTGMLAPNDPATFTAIVTPPATATGGTQNVFFRAISATNPAIVDTKEDAVTVTTVADLAITTNQSAQAAPGGVVVLNHTLSNVGNVAISSGSLTFTPFTTFAETLWVDKDGDGVLSSGDVQVASIADIVTQLGHAIAPGKSVLLFSRVQVPAGVAQGVVEQATLTVGSTLNVTLPDANTANNAVTEKVTVVTGNVGVVKTQALDATCDGLADGAFTQAAQSASPAQCVIYKVTATNLGTADATSVEIDDQTPSFTLEDGAATATGGSLPVVAQEPTAGHAGLVQSTHGTLAPGTSAVLTFRVKIDN